MENIIQEFCDQGNPEGDQTEQTGHGPQAHVPVYAPICSYILDEDLPKVPPCHKARKDKPARFSSPASETKVQEMTVKRFVCFVFHF